MMDAVASLEQLQVQLITETAMAKFPAMIAGIKREQKNNAIGGRSREGRVYIGAGIQFVYLLTTMGCKGNGYTVSCLYQFPKRGHIGS